MSKPFRLAVLALLVSFAAVQAAYGAACVCIKRSADDRIIGYSCTDTVGEGGAAECQTNCSNAGYPFYSFEPDTNCAKIKKEKVDITIKPTIPLGPIDIELSDLQVVTYLEQGRPQSYLEERQDTSSNAAGKAATVITPSVKRYKLPINGTATITSAVDDFDVPTFLGGGQATTSAISGSLSFKLTPSGNPNLLNVVVTGVTTNTASVTVPGGTTGNLQGTLNTAFPSVGLLDLQTGAIELLFSQILTSDQYPAFQVKTFSAYYGDCGACLSGAHTLLEGDSIYLEP